MKEVVLQMKLSICSTRELNSTVKMTKRRPLCLIAFILAGVLMIACCTGTNSSTIIPAEVAELRPGSGILVGYLPREAVPNSLKLLPAHPAGDSAAFIADQEAFRATRSLVDTPRWTQAFKDTILKFPQAAEHFSCVLDAQITEELTPNLIMLMRRSLTDAGLATYMAKNHYKRTRPFVLNKMTTCSPEEEAQLAKDGSYPSGHSAVGWAWALILTELAPERADAILARGYAFGQSRVVCGVHWQSDVTEGRVVASGVVAKLHTDPVFRAQLEAAKKELADARAKGIKPTNNCQAEAAALAF